MPRVQRKDAGVVFLFVAGLPGCLAGQAMVEHAVISGGVATAAAAVQRAAGKVGGTLKTLDGNLETAKKRPAAAPAVAEAQPAAVAVKPARVYEDPTGIKVGMSSVELRQRFGQPSMTVTGEDGEETLYYARKDGRPAPVRVSGGQVVETAAVE